MARRMAPMIWTVTATEPAGGWSAFWGAALGPYTGRVIASAATTDGSLAAIHARYDHPVAVYREDGVVTVVPDDGELF